MCGPIARSPLTSRFPGPCRPDRVAAVATTERSAPRDGVDPGRGPLRPLDFLDLDALLTPEELALRQTVRRFVQDRVLPGIEEWFERGAFPAEVFPELGGLGLLGMHLSGYGCAGASAV